MEETRKPDPWPGVAALFACAALWSLSGPLIKILGRRGVSGIDIAFYRSFFGALVYLPFAWRRRRTLKGLPAGWPAASVCLFTVMTACFVIATSQTAASSVIVLQYTAPLWVFLLSPLVLGERPRFSEGLVLLVSMIGVVILVLGSRGSGTTGLGVALVSGWAYGGLIVVLRRVRRADPSFVVWMNCAGSALLLAPGVAAWGAFRLPAGELGLLATMSLVQFTLPYLLFSWAIRRVEAHRASLILLIEPLLNSLWTYLVVGEKVPRATMIGGPFILAGVAGWFYAQLSAAGSQASPLEADLPAG